MTDYIIIGNGVAANTAAESIRKNDPQGSIRMFSKEKNHYYYIPALPEYLAGEKDVAGITLHDATWYRDAGIELHLETEVSSVDPDAGTVTTSGGATFSYDKLLLATGGYSFVPPITGSDTEGVYTLRTIADADTIRNKAAAAKELVLIGGGLLGLEAGNGLRRAGLNVTVVEFFPRLLPRQMDEAGAAVLQRQMEQMGFSFRLGAKTSEIVRAGEKLVVSLEGGEQLTADMVLVSAGVRPELGLAQSLQADIDKGVQVDDFMQTGRRNIYAAGDLIEHRGRFYGIWPAAMEQGRIAGKCMAGENESYNGTVPANTLKVVGIDLTAAGDIDADSNHEAIVHTDTDKNVYRKIVIQDDVIIGTILLGDISGSDRIMAAMKNRTSIAGMKEDMKNPAFDFSRIA